MIERKDENLEENKIKSARRRPAKRNYNKRENKIKEEVNKENKNIKIQAHLVFSCVSHCTARSGICDVCVVYL